MSSQGLTYTFHAPHIHEIVFHDVERSTLDQFFDQMESILDATPTRGNVKILIHVSELPSIQYMVSHNRRLRIKYPHAFQSQVAVIYKHAMPVHLLNMSSCAHAEHASPFVPKG